MRRPPRISIAGLMALIALLGVTFAAPHAGTEFSSIAMLTFALAASGVALLGRLCTRGTARVTWTGWLVFGTGYLAMCVGPWCDEHVMPYLLPTSLIDERYSNMEYTPKHAGERVWTIDRPDMRYEEGEVFGNLNANTIHFDVTHPRTRTTSRHTATEIRPISPGSYRRLWHSALSIWLGLLGMALARYLFGSRQDTSARARGTPSAPTP
jgi:hypothetical protein